MAFMSLSNVAVFGLLDFLFHGVDLLLEVLDSQLVLCDPLRSGAVLDGGSHVGMKWISGGMQSVYGVEVVQDVEVSLVERNT